MKLKMQYLSAAVGKKNKGEKKAKSHKNISWFGISFVPWWLQQYVGAWCSLTQGVSTARAAMHASSSWTHTTTNTSLHAQKTKCFTEFSANPPPSPPPSLSLYQHLPSSPPSRTETNEKSLCLFNSQYLLVRMHRPGQEVAGGTLSSSSLPASILFALFLFFVLAPPKETPAAKEMGEKQGRHMM